MATYNLTVENVSSGSAYNALKVINNNNFDIGVYGGTTSSNDIVRLKAGLDAVASYSIIITKKTSGSMTDDIDISDIILIGTSTYSIGHFIYLNENGIPTYTTVYSKTPTNITVSDTLSKGLETISVTVDSGISSVLYNNVSYDTFPATIPLDPAATTMQVESKSPVLTINDGGNLKSVTYGSATYTKFPATVTATAPEFAVTARGKDSPVITVRTERTQTPVITNT